jgi:hypothetical protein
MDVFQMAPKLGNTQILMPFPVARITALSPAKDIGLNSRMDQLGDGRVAVMSMVVAW